VPACPCYSVCDGVSELYCESGHCIPLSYICDGDSDCTDSTDERYCHTSPDTPAAATTPTTTPGHYRVISFILSLNQSLS